MAIGRASERERGWGVEGERERERERERKTERERGRERKREEGREREGGRAYNITAARRRMLSALCKRYSGALAWLRSHKVFRPTLTPKSYAGRFW